MRISPSANGAYRMSHNEPPAHVPLGESRPDNFLDSWKEIAAYLEREVRTVQRWEKKEGPPYTDKSTKNWVRCMPLSLRLMRGGESAAQNLLRSRRTVR